MINKLKSFFRILAHPVNRENKTGAIARLLWWKFNQKFIGLPSVVEMVKGVKYICYPESSFSGLVIYTKLPEYYEMKFMLSTIKNDDIVIDVGAHMGDYTLLAASKIKGGKVFSFEPDMTAYQGLVRNIEINKFGARVEASPVVVSDRNGKINFINRKNSEISQIFSPKLGNHGFKAKSIDSVSLDRFLSKKRVKQIKFAKIDVEGAELKVLKGFEKFLNSKSVKYLLVEITNDSLSYGVIPKETLKYLKDKGYTLYRFNNKGNKIAIKSFPPNVKYINVLAIA